MKFPLLLIVAINLLPLGASQAQNGDAVSLDFFYENLDPYGDWREVGDYGYCWRPRDVNPDWRPYSDGRWLYSDAGWTWDSDEPYSWAVYHYGRWANVASVGWVWVPGTEWGPGWVSWRYNDQYVGWAPLPPEARFQVNVGFSSWVDDYYEIGPGQYRFVENQHFGSRRLGSVFIDQSRNDTIIQRTTNITNIRYQNNIVRNDGPSYGDLSRMSADPIPRYKLQRRQEFDRDSNRHNPDRHRSRQEGDSLSVFAPPIKDRRPDSRPSRHAEKVDEARINRGWDRAGSPDEIAALRTKMKGTEEAPKELPPRPRWDRDGDRPGGPASKPVGRDGPPTERPDPDREKERPQKGPPGSTKGPDQPMPEPEVITPRPNKPDSERPEKDKPDPKSPEPDKPDPKRPERDKPEAKKPEIRKPETDKPESKRPEKDQPDSKKPEVRKPEPKQPEPKKPEVRKPKPKQPEPKKPEVRKPESKQPEARKPEPKKSETRREPPKREQPQKKPETSRPRPEARPPAPPQSKSDKSEDKKPGKKKADEKDE